jgi:hypothetical protein
MTTSNAHVNELEQVWESIAWERKTIAHPSSLEHEIVVTFSANHADEIEAAKDYFATHTEETDELVRSAWLASYSSGEKIVVVESSFD